MSTDISEEHGSMLRSGLGTLTSKPHSKSHKRRLREGQEDFIKATRQGYMPQEALKIAFKKACNFDSKSYLEACRVAGIKSTSQIPRTPPPDIARFNGRQESFSV